MNEELTCRQLALKDMADASNVFRHAFDARLPWLASRHSPEEDLAFWSGYVFANCAIWGVGRQDELVGVIAFRENWIDQLYVLPQFQGQGIGARLLKQAKSAHYVLNLWTFQRNVGARHFYEAHGFLARRETDGAENDEREPDVLYEWCR
ncbi:GNAT family N-acetyltransferase [Endobacterium cereale]|uniref:GNAT family N-acetyltransferase n=1 Tax=Endobacterium cereale TaxID=2663029 RepID=UPI002B467C12|nr:GNAT family N-acetyltransferase [Endobacterium cereale]MEB2843732.1 GNAT family N-acetyltransferase [Endobacterium cereale]